MSPSHSPGAEVGREVESQSRPRSWQRRRASSRPARTTSRGPPNDAHRDIGRRADDGDVEDRPDARPLAQRIPRAASTGMRAGCSRFPVGARGQSANALVEDLPRTQAHVGLRHGSDALPRTARGPRAGPGGGEGRRRVTTARGAGTGHPADVPVSRSAHGAHLSRRRPDRDRLPPSRGHGTCPSDRGLRHVPGLTGGGGQEPRAPRPTIRRNRRGPGDARAPRPLRLPAGRRPGWLQGSRLRHPCHGGAGGARAAGRGKIQGEHANHREHLEHLARRGQGTTPRATATTKSAAGNGGVTRHDPPADPEESLRRQPAHLVTATPIRSTRSRTRPPRRRVPRRRLRPAGPRGSRRDRDIPGRRSHPRLGDHRGRVENAVGDGTARRIVFSGDIGRPNTPILCDPTAINDGADYVLMESTYGGREHEPEAEAIRLLAEAVRAVADHSGVLLIPSFAIGRTQEIVWELDRLLAAGPNPARAVVPRLTDGEPGERHLPPLPRLLRRRDPRLLQEGETPLDYPGPDHHQHARTVTGDPRSAAADVIVSATGCSRAGGSCTTCRTSSKTRRCSCCSSGTRARARSVRTSRPARRMSFSTAPSGRCAARCARSAASVPTPTSTS